MLFFVPQLHNKSSHSGHGGEDIEANKRQEVVDEFVTGWLFADPGLDRASKELVGIPASYALAVEKCLQKERISRDAYHNPDL